VYHRASTCIHSARWRRVSQLIHAQYKRESQVQCAQRRFASHQTPAR
jgi:hypothetical protein